MPIINGQGRVAVRVSGITPAPSSSYLLDTYGGAAAAYSLRKLSNTYSGNAIRVRRSSDNTEQNIGFDGSGNLDTTALTTFVGAGNGFVTTWFDQSGNNKNFTQTTANIQPQIVTSGVVETKNGKPNLRFLYKRLTVNQVLQVPNYITFVGNNTSNTQSIYAGFVNYYSSGVSTENPEIILGNATNYGDGASIYWGGSVVGGTGNFGFLTNRIHTLTTTPGITMTYYGNNTQMATRTRAGTWASTTYNGISIGGNTIWGNRDCDFQEFIVYNIDQSSNRSLITTNINSFYSLYPSDADAAAFVSAAGITDSTQQSAVNTLVTSLKSAGLWTKMKAIYPFVGGTASAHKFNLKDPRDLDAAYRLVFNGGWTHSSTGAQPNGTNGYANTFLNPTNALNINSTHISYNSRTSTASFQNQCIMGVQTGANLRMILNYSNNEGFECNSVGGGYSPSSFTDLKGFFITTRNSSTQFSYYLNSNLVRNISSSSALPNGNVYLGSGNSYGSPFFYSPAESSFASIGDGLSSSDVTALNNAIQTFNTTLGRQV